MSHDEYIQDIKRRSAELELKYWELKVEQINTEITATKKKLEERGAVA